MKTLLGLALAAVIVIPAQAATRLSVPMSESPIIHVDNGCGSGKELYHEPHSVKLTCMDRDTVLKLKEAENNHRKEVKEIKKGGKEGEK